MNQIPNIEEEYRYYQAPNVPIERVFAQTNDGTRYELLEVNYHLKEEEELEETVEFDKVFDCFDEGCGECTVCKYINFREWAEGCAPAGSSIERNQLVEDYLKRKHHQLQKAREEERERIANGLDELMEKLADIEHVRWAKWQNYLHSHLTWNNEIQAWVLPHECKDRWQMQINKPYSMLSEKEKESDREQVRPYLELIKRKVRHHSELDQDKV